MMCDAPPVTKITLILRKTRAEEHSSFDDYSCFLTHEIEIKVFSMPTKNSAATRNCNFKILLSAMQELSEC